MSFKLYFIKTIKKELDLELEYVDDIGFEFNGVFHETPNYVSSEPKETDWDYATKKPKWDAHQSHKNLLNSIETLFNIKINDIVDKKVTDSIKRKGYIEFINEYSDFKLKK